MIGKVKWFDAKKGYGFILNEENEQIFVHYTSIISDKFRSLSPGQRVEYQITDGDHGRMAVEVKVIKR